MSGDHAQQAIKAALTGDWEKARDLNSSIVKDEPDCTNNDSQYYKVLTDGKIVSWFKPNIEIYNERTSRIIS